MAKWIFDPQIRILMLNVETYGQDFYAKDREIYVRSFHILMMSGYEIHTPNPPVATDKLLMGMFETFKPSDGTETTMVQRILMHMIVCDCLRFSVTGGEEGLDCSDELYKIIMEICHHEMERIFPLPPVTIKTYPEREAEIQAARPWSEENGVPAVSGPFFHELRRELEAAKLPENELCAPIETEEFDRLFGFDALSFFKKVRPEAIGGTSYIINSNVMKALLVERVSARTDEIEEEVARLIKIHCEKPSPRTGEALFDLIRELYAIKNDPNRPILLECIQNAHDAYDKKFPPPIPDTDTE